MLAGSQARRLLDSIDPGTLTGLRDRAPIAVMVYSFGRVSAVIGMDVEDVYLHGARRWIRLREKGGREHAVPLHDRGEECLVAYMAAAGIADGPMFRATIGGRVTPRRIGRLAAWEMVKRRARDAGPPAETTNHTFRATGITVWLIPWHGGTGTALPRLAFRAPRLFGIATPSAL